MLFKEDKQCWPNKQPWCYGSIILTLIGSVYNKIIKTIIINNHLCYNFIIMTICQAWSFILMWNVWIQFFSVGPTVPLIISAVSSNPQSIQNSSWTLQTLETIFGHGNYCVTLGMFCIFAFFFSTINTINKTKPIASPRLLPLTPLIAKTINTFNSNNNNNNTIYNNYHNIVNFNNNINRKYK